MMAMGKRLRTERDSEGEGMKMMWVASQCRVWIDKSLQPDFKSEQDSHT